MTRKDYIRIAAALKSATSHFPATSLANVAFRDGAAFAANKIADALAQEPGTRFDRAKFLKAAGVVS